MSSLKACMTRKRPARRVAFAATWCGFALLGGLLAAGCGSGVHVAAPATTTSANTGAQTYFSGAVNGDASGLAFTNELGTYTIDDAAKTFSQSTYLFGENIDGNLQNGPQLNYSGNIAPLKRGLLSLGSTYIEGRGGPVDEPTPVLGSWAIELADRSGGLVALSGLPFTPLAAAETCPASSTAQGYNFVSIPTLQTTSLTAWSPSLETAYGSVNVSGDGASVVFAGIQQFAIDGTQIRNYSTIGISPAPVAYTSIGGECSPTFYGNTTSVTGTLTITNPGNNGETVENTATVAVAPSGLLVESNGNGYTTPEGVSGAKVLPSYQPFMGAGTGALGLPVPASAVAASDLAGAQYMGFFYGFDGKDTSTVASFGFASGLPASCATVTAQTGTLIYGGDFANNDPSAAAVQASGGFGSCDAAIDLGAQDATQNGLFPNAIVTEGASFASNSMGVPKALPAVAIAGKLNGKFAIFLITSTGQGIYLLQTN